jgi:hypothetical protein
MNDPRSAASSSCSRRELLAAGPALAGIGLAALAARPAVAAPRARALDADDLLDAALERIHARFPDVNIHASNHAPMVCEALGVLGRADAMAAWLDENPDDFERGPGARQPIDPAHWRAALADATRFADWQVFFLTELAGEDWRLVLRRWIPRLAPGLAAAATHGVIRAGHAARALSVRENDTRRRELAIGLAYWAINYQELPWDGSLAPEPSVEAALATLVPRQPGIAPPRGNIITGLTALEDTPSFRPVAGRVDVRDPLRTLGEITRAFAALYLRNPERRIHFTHAVTAPSALRLLAPYLDDETLAAGVRYAWQAAAGLYVVYGDPRRPAPDAPATAARETVVTTAVRVGGAHGIKLTEACLREHALAPDPTFLATAQDASASLTF